MSREKKQRSLGAAPMTRAAAVLWTLGMLAIEQVALALADVVRPGALTDLVTLAGCNVLAASLAVLLYARLRAPEASLRQLVGLRRPPVRHVLLATVCGAGLAPVLSRLDERILARFPYDDPDAVASTERLVASAPRGLLIVLLFVVIPVARDVFFRGLLFEGIAQTSRRRAIGLSAILLAVASVDPRGWPSMILLGLALGWLRAQGASLVPAIAGDLAFGAVDAIAIGRGLDPLRDVAYGPVWVVGGGLLASAALGLAAIKVPREG